ncbi:hypothetical protein GCM10009821_10360 [Aeromicrobium halocynthiae]|uniref:Uncharacterized protein n=1 Tax=Aeromicrobium halocynthiae TaxID=560557 RepID=A0ABN2VV44_9ACTN
MSWFLLLTPAQTTGILLQGWDVVSGRVLPEAEATFADADVARAALGHPDPQTDATGAAVGRFVDFLLLPDDLPVLDVRDGVLAPTRAPSGTSYWRMEADGSRHLISWYDTPAFGWRNMRGPVWPASEVGLRARWRDLDVVAALEAGVDGLHLVARSAEGEDPPEGFEWTKTRVSRRTVPLEECETYERVALVVQDGVPGRVVDVTDGTARVLMEGPVTGSRELGPDAHLLEVGVEELSNLLTREIPRSVG